MLPMIQQESATLLLLLLLPRTTTYVPTNTTGTTTTAAAATTTITTTMTTTNFTILGILYHIQCSSGCSIRIIHTNNLSIPLVKDYILYTNL